ncbi:MAG: hypothetical protein K0R11_2154, partial [Acidimicrobiales bacterium]|nr:hypothetical protein [Acidimicrobiales bacterium]
WSRGVRNEHLGSGIGGWGPAGEAGGRH